MLLNQEKTLFLIIDVQEKLLNAIFNKESVKKEANILAEAARVLNIPVIVTEQYPKGLGQTIGNINDNAQVFEKTSFNAIEDLELLSEIKKSGRNQIIVFGIETHICVYQTVVALLDEKFDVTVVADACGSRAEREYNFGIDCMKRYGASIKTAEMVLFELLKSSKHPNFKDIQALIK